MVDPAPTAKPTTSRRRAEPWPIPQTGALRAPKGRQVARAVYAARQAARSLHAAVEQDDGTSLVSIEGHPSLRVTVRTTDYRRLVQVDKVTATRWILEDGEIRAYRVPTPYVPDHGHTYSVAALILGAQDGDVIHMEDYLDLRPERMRLERRGGH